MNRWTTWRGPCCSSGAKSWRRTTHGWTKTWTSSWRRCAGIGNFTAQEIFRLKDLARADRLQHPSDWLTERAIRMRLPAEPKPGGPWGWKEPNTHLLLPYLVRRFPDMRYIHVVRHGLDMAFSSNQNQLATWGEQFQIPADLPPPVRSLRYWIAAQRRARDLGTALGSRSCGSTTTRSAPTRDRASPPGAVPATARRLIRIVSRSWSDRRRLKVDIGNRTAPLFQPATCRRSANWASPSKPRRQLGAIGWKPASGGTAPWLAHKLA